VGGSVSGCEQLNRRRVRRVEPCMHCNHAGRLACIVHARTHTPPSYMSRLLHLSC
jgi:hypothetical protein